MGTSAVIPVCLRRLCKSRSALDLLNLPKARLASFVEFAALANEHVCTAVASGLVDGAVNCRCTSYVMRCMMQALVYAVSIQLSLRPHLHMFVQALLQKDQVTILRKGERWCDVNVNWNLGTNSNT